MNTNLLSTGTDGVVGAGKVSLPAFVPSCPAARVGTRPSPCCRRLASVPPPRSRTLGSRWRGGFGPAALGAFLLAAVASAQTVDTSRVLWEVPSITGITGADDLVQELRYQVQRVLDAGHLAPLYVSHADQESVGYTVYQEPGRIITTLAWAYPHLSADQQAATRAYVNAEFANATNAPWGVTSYGKNGTSNYPLPQDSGVAREEHPKSRWWHARNDFGNARPFLHTLYGVWLYGHVSGDWTSISNHWSDIRRVYTHYGDSDAYKLYGTMSVHIALARLAWRFGDASTGGTASNRLDAVLRQGLDLTAVETLARGTPGNEWRSPYGSYPSMYDRRMDSSTYHGWIFLNLTPEIGRHLRNADPGLRDAVLARHASGQAVFPLWFLPKASYFNRSWTGDEGSGLVPEVMGMFAPVERWVAAADASTLRRTLRGAPNGIGDCYWLEALVQAIEAHGLERWVDLRWSEPSLEKAARLPAGGFRVTVDGTTGQAYTLQRSLDLQTWHWGQVYIVDNRLALSPGAEPSRTNPEPSVDSVHPEGRIPRVRQRLSCRHPRSSWNSAPRYTTHASPRRPRRHRPPAHRHP